jgi:predicted Zn-dependent peptidase
MKMTNFKQNSAVSLPGPEDIHREVLPNGITVLTRSNFNSPSVVVSGYFGAGALFDPDEKLGLADFVTSALMRGTKKRSFDKIYNELESVGIVNTTCLPESRSREVARTIADGPGYPCAGYF